MILRTLVLVADIRFNHTGTLPLRVHYAKHVNTFHGVSVIMLCVRAACVVIDHE